jgi:hypothetical protein
MIGRAKLSLITSVIVAAVAPCSGLAPVRRYWNNSFSVHGTGDGLAAVNAGATHPPNKLRDYIRRSWMDRLGTVRF